jgi:FKBP-type peptidyl-prolyl cis-trans isomerase FklB
MLRRSVLLGLSGLILAACGKKAVDPAVLGENAAVAQAFMEKTAKEPGVQKLPSGVLYKVEKSGPATGRSPNAGDEVKVHYEGKLITGEIFDSSYERGSPVVMGLTEASEGNPGLIGGWVDALQKMKPGDVWIVYIPPARAYGEGGTPGGEIPPNAALIFKIELIDSLASTAPVLG